MPSEAAISFVPRGLTGLLLTASGLAACLRCRQRSAWGPEMKQLVFPRALALVVGGSSSVSKLRAAALQGHENRAVGFNDRDSHPTGADVRFVGGCVEQTVRTAALEQDTGI